MPSKRSTAKERERKRKYRENMSEEKANRERKKAQEGMKLLREGRVEAIEEKERPTMDENWYAKLLARIKEKRANQTEVERQKERDDLRERMRKLRSRKSVEDIAIDNEKAKQGMRESRSKQSEDKRQIKEYIKIVEKHKKRDSRDRRSGKEHLVQNLQSKKGMRMLKSGGRQYDFQRRMTKSKTECLDWKGYLQRGEKYRELLENEKPDVVEQLNEQIRNDKERERKWKEEENKKETQGYWEYRAESDEYFWTGEQDPDHGDPFCSTPLTEEDKKIIREAEKMEFELFVEERKELQKVKRKQKERERKEAMAIPIDPLPEHELCDYEKLRENNIKERKNAMMECGFFEDLMSIKKEIGFPEFKNENKSDKKKKRKKEIKGANK